MIFNNRTVEYELFREYMEREACNGSTLLDWSTLTFSSPQSVVIDSFDFTLFMSALVFTITAVHQVSLLEQR